MASQHFWQFVDSLFPEFESAVGPKQFTLQEMSWCVSPSGCRRLERRCFPVQKLSCTKANTEQSIQLYKERPSLKITWGYVMFAGIHSNVLRLLVKYHNHPCVLALVIWLCFKLKCNVDVFSVVNTVCDMFICGPVFNGLPFFSFQNAHSDNEKLDPAHQEVT